MRTPESRGNYATRHTPHAASNLARETLRLRRLATTTDVDAGSAIYLSLIAGSIMNPAFGAGLLAYVVLPSVLGQPFLRFYLMAEHRSRSMLYLPSFCPQWAQT